MAALSIGNSFHTRKSSAQEEQIINGKRNISRTLVIVCCQTRFDPSSTRPEMKKEKDIQEKRSQIFVGMEKLGKGLKDSLSLSPKRKGDWKDLVLMSLSFAVYVYISQKIVCTYCAWMSLLKHPWQ